MLQDNKILLGAGENPVYMIPKMANRHGLIAGATGTGKTVTLKVMAEGFSEMGVPVFLADVKGDVSTLALAGTPSSKVSERLAQIGVKEEDFAFKGFPCRFWDVFGQDGIPVRATSSDLGPALLSRLLGLTDVQAGVLNIVFHVADDLGWLMLDFKDLRAMLSFVADHKDELTTTYGNIATSSIGAIQRALLVLEDQGAQQFFGEPDLNIMDWLNLADDGRGVINVLHCVKLVQQPLLYATFMLWMLSSIYEALPEVGDLEKPKLVFFFDEAHMLFKDAPKALLEKVTQVVKLIRSKGVGIYFISQSPSDIPDEVLSQLNNRVQHALHAYTPADQKAVRIAAQSFRPNPKFKTEDAIANMGTGVALVSMLDENGAPMVVEQATIAPPQSGFTPLDDAARAMLISKDGLYAVYKDAVDNVSAFEKINEVREDEAEEQRRLAEEAEAAKQAAIQAKEEEKAAKQAQRDALRAKSSSTNYGKSSFTGNSAVSKALNSAAKSGVRTVGRDIGKQISRGILGTSSNNLASRVASNAMGTFTSNLLSSFFK